jgi:hypothetical protein
MANLTKPRLEAIIDALNFSIEMRQEGALATSRSEYEAAREWATLELHKREGTVKRRRPTNALQFLPGGTT